MAGLRRFLPLLLLLAGMAAALLLVDRQWLDPATWPALLQQWRQWAEANRLLALPVTVGLYALVVALSLPVATLATLGAGLILGGWLGTLASVLGATAGAGILFLAARHAAGSWVQGQTAGWLAKLRDGFQRDAFGYLLFLRLVPLFPFVVVNLAPALLNMRLRPYLLATLVGVVPGSAAYAFIGSGLVPSDGLSLRLNPELLFGMGLLGVLVLVATIWKRQKK